MSVDVLPSKAPNRSIVLFISLFTSVLEVGCCVSSFCLQKADFHIIRRGRVISNYGVDIKKINLMFDVYQSLLTYDVLNSLQKGFYVMPTGQLIHYRSVI